MMNKPDKVKVKVIKCPLCGQEHKLKIRIFDPAKRWGRLAYRCPEKDEITDVALKDMEVVYE